MYRYIVDQPEGGERHHGCFVQIFGRGGQATVQPIARAARATTKATNHMYRDIYIMSTYTPNKQTNKRPETAQWTNEAQEEGFPTVSPIVGSYPPMKIPLGKPAT